MSSGALAVHGGGPNGITADRYELDYLLPAPQTQDLIDHLDGQLARAPAYAVTTVYFDTKGRRLLSAALSEARESVKLRVKEYFSEPAANFDAGGDGVWLELKRRSGARTQKHRVQLSRGALERWFAERAPLSDYQGHESDARLLDAYLAAEPEALAPACVVSYRRRAWQAHDGQLRLTLDTSLTFFAPPAELLRESSPFRERLGPPCAAEPRALLEVKHRSHAPPSWLDERLAELGLEVVEYSKFVSAAQAVSPVARHVSV